MNKDSESENEMLAREWMALEHWGGWRVGMVCAVTGQVVVRVDERANIWSDTLPRVAPPGTCPTPDISHPGTRAFLLEDVRKAWGEPELSCAHSRDCGWMVVDRGLIQILIIEPAEPTEQAALMAALRAAPEKTK